MVKTFRDKTNMIWKVREVQKLRDGRLDPKGVNSE